MHLHLLIAVLELLWHAAIAYENPDPTTAWKSPFNQYLPNCVTAAPPTIRKQANIKAMSCPMVKDELGFLSEWVAYHLMHGLDYIQFYDDRSHNHSFDELKPWINSGQVSVVNADINKDISYKGVMRGKVNAEKNCKEYAFAHGYDLMLSLDLDEYLVPQNLSSTGVDELWNMMVQRGDYAAILNKHNFNSAPHLLEPINLLTIEAYQTKVSTINKMTYFKSVFSKTAIRMTGPLYNPSFANHSLLLEYVLKCTFHGCFVPGKPPLNSLDISYFKPSGKNTYPVPTLYHYGRSLEKFGLKAKTWRTSGGWTPAYNLVQFFDRSVGWTFDDRAAQYGCQVRSILRKVTKQPVYYRPGDMWYRNTEFGLVMNDGEKGHRNGAPVKENEMKSYNQPYHYHGSVWPYEQQAKQFSSRKRIA
jgi:hypothetical protein